MPGPVSDSYDPEWGTGEARHHIATALRAMHGRVSGILGNQPPLDIRKLAGMERDLNHPVDVTLGYQPLTEWEWRIIRFALERAGESI